MFTQEYIANLAAVARVALQQCLSDADQSLQLLRT